MGTDGEKRCVLRNSKAAFTHSEQRSGSFAGPSFSRSRYTRRHAVEHLRQGEILLLEFKRLRDEERYYETLMFAEQLQGQLLHYEETLAKHSMTLPYTVSIKTRMVHDDFVP